MNLTRSPWSRVRRSADGGFSLIELLVVILVLGVLATIVVFAVGGFRDEAEDGACTAEGRILTTAAQAYFAQEDVTNLPAANATLDGYEQTLIDYQLLKAISGRYDLDMNGELVAVLGSQCTV